jgi:hypothetical protein
MFQVATAETKHGHPPQATDWGSVHLELVELSRKSSKRPSEQQLTCVYAIYKNKHKYISYSTRDMQDFMVEG